jgi:hypothetical protein
MSLFIALTNSMKKGACEANSHLTNKKIPHIVRNQNIHHCSHKPTTEPHKCNSHLHMITLQYLPFLSGTSAFYIFNYTYMCHLSHAFYKRYVTQSPRFLTLIIFREKCKLRSFPSCSFIAPHFVCRAHPL